MAWSGVAAADGALVVPSVMGEVVGALVHGPATTLAMPNGFVPAVYCTAATAGSIVPSAFNLSLLT